MDARKGKAIGIDLYFLTVAGYEALDVLNSFQLTQTVKLSYETMQQKFERYYIIQRWDVWETLE